MMEGAITVPMMVLDAWPRLHTIEAFGALTTIAGHLFAHDACIWEIHADGQRVDYTASIDLCEPRSRSRLLRWLDARADNPPCDGGADRASAERGAYEAMRHLLTMSPQPRALYCERDSRGEGIGVFAAPEIPEATQAGGAAMPCFAVSTAVERRARVLADSLRGQMGLQTLGRFWGRGGTPALCMTFRPMAGQRYDALPVSVLSRIRPLLDALAPGSAPNLAARVHPEHTAFALEVSPPTRGDAYKHPAAWLDAMLPSPSPAHAALVDCLARHTAPIAARKWPVETLLDAFVAPNGAIPGIQSGISHVKLREVPGGAVEGKLYVRFDTVWGV